MGSGVKVRIGKFLVQSPLDPWLGLRTQPCYKAPGDLQVKIVKTQCLTSGETVPSIMAQTKLVMGQPNSY